MNKKQMVALLKGKEGKKVNCFMDTLVLGTVTLETMVFRVYCKARETRLVESISGTMARGKVIGVEVLGDSNSIIEKRIDSITNMLNKNGKPLTEEDKKEVRQILKDSYEPYNHTGTFRCEFPNVNDMKKTEKGIEMYGMTWEV